MKVKVCFFICIALLLAGYCFSAGKTFQAKDCSLAAVQAVINKAGDKDIVLIPPGKAQWKGHVTVENGMTIQGAGIDKTIISTGGFIINGKEGVPFRVTGITFQDGYSWYGSISNIHIKGTCKNFRVDHCSFAFKNRWKNAIYVQGHSYGVIDHCDITNARVLVIEAMTGNEPWKRPLNLGSREAVYVEDCTFFTDMQSPAIDANGGARYVFRYNIVKNGYCLVHGLQNKDMRGTFSYEIYNNTFISTKEGKHNYAPVFLKSGTGVVFNNSVRNEKGESYNNVGVVQNDRSCNHLSENWKPCGGKNPHDGNAPGMSGYPCMDQIGRSTDAGPESVHPQAHEPLYAWNNTFDGKKGNLVSAFCTESRGHVKEGRDFFNNKKRPDYKPYLYPHPLNDGKAPEGKAPDNKKEK